MLENLKAIAQDFTIICTGIVGISTILAHIPFMPPRAAAFLARIGVAFGKFAVVQKDAQ